MAGTVFLIGVLILLPGIAIGFFGKDPLVQLASLLLKSAGILLLVAVWPFVLIYPRTGVVGMFALAFWLHVPLGALVAWSVMTSATVEGVTVTGRVPLTLTVIVVAALLEHRPAAHADALAAWRLNKVISLG